MSTLTAADLQPLLDRAAAEYLEIKTRAEKRAARWVWATGPVFEQVPGFHREIHGSPAPELLAAEPKKRAGAFHYGLDAGEEPMVLRQYNEFAGHFREEFFIAGPGRRDVWSYGPDPRFKDPYWVARFLQEGGRITAYAMLQKAGVAFSEAYEYEGDRLVIRRRIQDGTTYAYEHAYDAEGRIATITLVTGPRSPNVVYERSRSGARRAKASARR